MPASHLSRNTSSPQLAKTRFPWLLNRGLLNLMVKKMFPISINPVSCFLASRVATFIARALVLQQIHLEVAQ